MVPALAALALGLAACGSSSSHSSSPSSTSATPTATSTSTSSSSSGGSGATLQVTMKNLAFNPKTVHAKVGQTIEWTNDDSPPHDVSYVSGPKFKSSGTMGTGSTFRLKLTQAGTIQYFCSIHPFMKATIVVNG
jgi:plastocyanin